MPVEASLSHNQRALWYLYRLAPENSAYLISRAVRISGKLEIPSLQRAFQALVDRHAVLRTTFAVVDGEPVQRIHQRVEAAFRTEDASRWSEESLRQRLQDEAQRPCVLEQGPVVRLHLFTRSLQDNILLLVIHHIVADLWSLTILTRELGELYQAMAAGQSATLAPVTFDYLGFVRWQRDLLAGPTGRELDEYWAQRLAGNLQALNLPTDRRRPEVQTYHGSSVAVTLNGELSRRLVALSRAQGTSLYVLLLAAFEVLLHRYTGQIDIVVGSPAAGRTRMNLRSVVGYLVNPLPLRTDLGGNPTFETVVGRVRRTVLSAMRRQDYPFVLMAERLLQVRDPSRAPIFQVMFVMQTAPVLSEQNVVPFAVAEPTAEMTIGNLQLHPITLSDTMTQFDITMTAAQAGGGLHITLEYNCDLLDGSTAERMLIHYQMLLEGAVGDPTCRIGDLPLLAPAERYSLLVEWNDTASDYPAESCLPDLLEQQAVRTPHEIAVVDGYQRLTFAELHARANRLARYLRRLGAGPEARIGVYMNRSANMVVGLLGILKAGAAYVPLDTTHPQERLAYVIGDTGLSVVVAETATADVLPTAGLQVVRLDADWDRIAREPATAPTHQLLPENLAYVLYTSGSTGRPHGVALTHSNVVGFLDWAARAFPAEDRAGVLASTTISFDLSIFEIFLPLSAGGIIILAENALEWFRLPCAAEVTLVNSVPSVVRELLVHGPLPGPVRTLNLAGEPLPVGLTHDLYHESSVGRILNLYGPTEATTYATFSVVPRGAETVPIGRPIASTRIYLLDDRGQPVPVGVPGEIYIGGIGLARGHLNRPGLTAERFVPDPFSGEAGARLYRTGDLARYRPNRDLEFLGRVDAQVKLHGIRVEPAEIEAALESHPAIAQAAVVSTPISTARGEYRLLAYVVPRDGRSSAPDALRDFLAGKLPRYMIPSSFVTLEALPRTSSGKLDRRNLPHPQTGSNTPEAGHIAPRTPAEETVARIWCEVLGVESVGVHDDFFALGGHSLLAMRVVTRVSDALQADLTLRSLLQAPTVHGLVQAAEEAYHRTGEADEIAALLDEIEQISG